MLFLFHGLSVPVKSFTLWQEGGDVNFFELVLSFLNAFLTDDISLQRHFTLQNLYSVSAAEDCCT